MLSTRRSRVRVLGGTAMAAVVAGIGAVTFNASAAEVAAPAAVGAEARAVSVPGIPAAVKPPTGSRPIGAFVVLSGTQSYTCVVATGATTGAYTGSATPEAQLVGTGGKIHHFAGPSWQSERDQSLVKAKKVAESARTGTIPELLLQVTTHEGTGILDKADYISRLATSGGVAPTGSCTSGQVAAVTYKAIYVFWDAPASSPAA